MRNEKPPIIEHEEFAAIFAIGANFFSQGQYQKAQVIFAGLIALNASSEEASIAYGESLLMSGHISKAMHHFLSAQKRFHSPLIEKSIAQCVRLLKKMREGVH